MSGLQGVMVRWKLILVISAAMVAPCVWHRHIEAGDLGSHAYNGWLAQLIEKGQGPGLYITKQWNNILFDVTLLRVGNVVGFGAAEKIVVSACVLIVFWGVFSLVAVMTERPPWMLTPCIGMLVYGYSFQMGFMNYCLSIGLACFGLAILWQARGTGWIIGLLLAGLTYLAHPIGFLWMVGVFIYIRIRGRIRGWWKLILPIAAAAALCVVRWYAASHPALVVDWERGPFYFYNGADQLGLYGERYFWLAGVVFLFGVICVTVEAWKWWKERLASEGRPYDGSASTQVAVGVKGRLDDRGVERFALTIELYVVAILTVAMIPENLKPPSSAGWIGLLGSRLTTIVAIFGLALLGRLKPRWWHLAGFGTCAAIFFVFLHQDTGWLNQLEANAEQLVRNLPAGTRVVVNVSGPADSRITFIGHSVERACIGHCFSYANYEPSSGQFRVRVQKGSPVVTDSADDSEDMASGTYEVQDTDPPLKLIYQCNPQDLRKLCLKDLAEGDLTNGAKAPGSKP